MKATLVPVPVADKPQLREVLLPYFAEIAPEVTDPPGRYFDDYWKDTGRWPLWIMRGQARVGFALVRSEGQGRELAEFGIVPAWRRRGVGAMAARAVFMRFPGPWALGVAKRSPGGLAFWRKVVETCPGVRNIEKGPPFYPLQIVSLKFEIGSVT